jgi:hypothetical protein
MAKDKLEEKLAQAHSTRVTTECFRRESCIKLKEGSCSGK